MRITLMIVHKLSMPPLSTNANQNPFEIGIHKVKLVMDVNQFSKGFSFSLVALMALRVCGQSLATNHFPLSLGGSPFFRA